MRKILLIAIIVLSAIAWAGDAKLPGYNGPVNDIAGVLNRNTVSQLTSETLAYREKTGNEIGVLIVPTLGDYSLEDYAHDVFKTWGIGQKGKDNGVLFLVAIKERKARVEVGYGLEGELTDIECGRLVNMNSPMAQYFRKGDYGNGIYAVVMGIEQAIGGEYKNPPAPKNNDRDNSTSWMPIGFIIFFLIISYFRRKSLGNRRFGGPFIGGFGGGGGSFGGGSSGGGGFSFGGGSSGGGGASGGW